MLIYELRSKRRRQAYPYRVWALSSDYTPREVVIVIGVSGDGDSILVERTGPARTETITHLKSATRKTRDGIVSFGESKLNGLKARGRLKPEWFERYMGNLHRETEPSSL